MMVNRNLVPEVTLNECKISRVQNSITRKPTKLSHVPSHLSDNQFSVLTCLQRARIQSHHQQDNREEMQAPWKSFLAEVY